MIEIGPNSRNESQLWDAAWRLPRDRYLGRPAIQEVIRSDQEADTSATVTKDLNTASPSEK